MWLEMLQVFHKWITVPLTQETELAQSFKQSTLFYQFLSSHYFEMAQFLPFRSQNPQTKPPLDCYDVLCKCSLLCLLVQPMLKMSWLQRLEALIFMVVFLLTMILVIAIILQIIQIQSLCQLLCKFKKINTVTKQMILPLTSQKPAKQILQDQISAANSK